MAGLRLFTFSDGEFRPSNGQGAGGEARDMRPLN